MQKEATAQEQARVQVHLTGHISASYLIEALSADPVNPALKQTLKKNSRCSAQKTATTSQQKEGAMAEEE